MRTNGANPGRHRHLTPQGADQPSHAEGADHRRRRLHRLTPRRVPARRRLGGLRARRPLDRVDREHRPPCRPRRLPPGRRQRARARRRQRARAQVRRRLPPRRRRRGAADRRGARPHDRHEHPGHRDRARPLQPLRQARPDRVHERGLRRPPRAAPAARDRPPDLRPDDTAALGVRRLEGDGRVPRARLRPRARPQLRHRAPVQHGRPAPDRDVRHGHPELRRARAHRARRSRSTARASRPAASATSATPSAPSAR